MPKQKTNLTQKTMLRKRGLIAFNYIIPILSLFADIEVFMEVNDRHGPFMGLTAAALSWCSADLFFTIQKELILGK